MKRFAAGEIDALVATTVIEVGVDVPNATIMWLSKTLNVLDFPSFISKGAGLGAALNSRIVSCLATKKRCG